MIETITVPGIPDPWTLFWDMHSGGGLKLPYHYIYIQADEEEARRIFEQKFGRSSYGQACDTCGPNWSVSTVSGLRSATTFQRDAMFELDEDGNEQPFHDGRYGYSKPIQSMEEFLARPNILVLSTSGESLIIFDDLQVWTYRRAEQVALMRGYHQFAFTNTNGQKGGGYLTGRGSYTPISRREPAPVLAIA